MRETTSEDGDGAFIIVCAPNQSVVTFVGELDLATRDRCYEELVSTASIRVIFDLTFTTFMDCGGYGAIAAARTHLEKSGRSLEFTGAGGEPALLLDLISCGANPDLRTTDMSSDQARDPAP